MEAGTEETQGKEEAIGAEEVNRLGTDGGTGG